MRDDHHGHARLLEIVDDLQHFADQFGVKGGRHFIEQQHFGFGGEGADDGDTLLLAAGKLLGIGLCVLAKAEQVEQLHRGGFGVGAGATVDLDRGERYVLQHAHRGEQVVGLEDNADLLVEAGAAEALVVDIDAVDADAALVELGQPVDAAQQRRLAGARRADQADDFVVGHAEVDLVQHLALAVEFGELFDFDAMHSRGHPGGGAGGPCAAGDRSGAPAEWWRAGTGSRRRRARNN